MKVDAYHLMRMAGAIQENGHFRSSAGFHLSTYIDKDAISADTITMSDFCYRIGEHFYSGPVEVVVGPELGAIVAAHVVGQQINHIRAMMVASHGIPSLVKVAFAVKKQGGGFQIRPSMKRYVQGKKALVVEDILTTGGSAAETVKAVLEAGAASVIGVSAFCNRGGVTKEDLGIPDGELFSLLDLGNLPKYRRGPETCPMCKAGIPLNTEFGHGAK